MIRIINICKPLNRLFKKWKCINNSGIIKNNENVVISKDIIINNKDNKEPLDINEIENIEKNIEEKEKKDEQKDSIKTEKISLNKEPKIKKYLTENKITKSNQENINNKNNAYKTYKNQKKIFIENVHKRIKFKNLIIKILNYHIGINYYFNKWKKQTYNNINKEKEFETIITSSTIVHHKTHIPKRKFYPNKNEFQKENIEINQNKKNLTIDQQPKRMDILLNKMDEKRKKKLLIKFIRKISENKEEVLKDFFKKWKNNFKDKINDDINNIKVKKKRLITNTKNKKEEPIKNDINEKETEIEINTKTQKDSKSNLYIKHRPHALNITSSTKNNQENKKNIIFTQTETIEIKTTKIETTKMKTEYPIKPKKNIINEKIKPKIIKEEIKKFTLPNPKKETTKEYQIIINPIQRKEQFDSFDLNLPSLPEKIPKIPEKKSKKIENIKKDNNNNNDRFTHSRIRSNFGKCSDLLSPVYRSNKRTIDNEHNENNSINDEDGIHVRKKLKFDKISSTIDNEELNTISLKNDASIQKKDFGYKTYTFIPRKKIIHGKEIAKKIERNRFKDKVKEIINNKNNVEEKDTKKRFERRIFSNEKKEGDIKSKTFNAETKIEFKIKEFNLENQCKKEYYKDYNNFILCEEIVYKCYDDKTERYF